MPTLEPDEVAWLATQEDVESRLVITDKRQRSVRYRVQNGPFTENELRALPASDWTLLVNDVEKHLPDFRCWYRLVPFIPDWRIDDVMISVAAPGGSVGPHRDNYDVFLCQCAGERHWSISEQSVTDSTNKHLALVEPFEGDGEILAIEGDAIYLPPGIAHWGVARSLSVTLSIGMRAPTLAELQQFLGHESGARTKADDAIFYADADLRPGEAQPGQISRRSLDRARHLFSDATRPLNADLEIAFGCAVTSLKAWLVPDPPEDPDVESLLQTFHAGDFLFVHGMSRLAWLDCGEHALVFLNGACLKCPVALVPGIRHMAEMRNLSRDCFGMTSSEELVEWLVAHAAFVADENLSQ